MAKKNSHDERREKGLAALVAAGIATDAPATTSIASLEGAIGKSPEADIAAVFLLGKIAAHESVELLRRIEKSASDKDVKKEIKRALFKLAQKGLAIANDAGEEKKPAALFERTPDIEAYMSAVDGGGGCLIWINYALEATVRIAARARASVSGNDPEASISVHSIRPSANVSCRSATVASASEASRPRAPTRLSRV